MRLINKELADKTQWEKAGIQLPKFDREAMLTATKKTPKWLHLGPGNIFRAFLGALAQNLLENGLEETGIITVEAYDNEIIDKCYSPFDNLCLSVTLKSDGNIEKKIIAYVASSYRIDKETDAVKEIFTSPSLQIVSFTITEKGYALRGQDGALLPDIAEDLNTGPGSAKSCLGRIAALCHERYTHGAFPLA